MNKLSRREEEKQTVEQMIRFYCRHKEGNSTLCQDCKELLEYAHQRLSHCPFGEQKNLPTMPGPLLPSGNETTHQRGHAICRSPHAMALPHLDPQTLVERTMTTHKVWIFSTIIRKIPQYFLIRPGRKSSDFQHIKHFLYLWHESCRPF